MHSYSKIFISAFILVQALFSAGASTGFSRELTVQVFSSADKTKAEQIKRALQKEGFDACISRYEAAGVLYRVRIGRFSDRKNALKLQQTLSLKNWESWIAPADDEVDLQAGGTQPGKTSEKQNAAVAEQEKPSTRGAESSEFSNHAPSDQQAPAPAPAERKIFELIVNPAPAFAVQQIRAPAAVPQCRAHRQYSYFDPQGATLHITADRDKIPAHFQKRLHQITVFPATFRRMDLQALSLSLHLEVEQQTLEITLDGITPARQAPFRQAERAFEALLREEPLLLQYYPPRTDPDGTLHGAVFFKNGLSVEQELVRLGIAEPGSH